MIQRKQHHHQVVPCYQPQKVHQYSSLAAVAAVVAIATVTTNVAVVVTLVMESIVTVLAVAGAIIHQGIFQNKARKKK